MNNIQEPLFVDDGTGAPRLNLPFVEREAITAIVRNPKTGEYLGLQWKQVDWETFITGGIKDDQTAEEAARAEIYEESGYKNLRLITELPKFHAKFYHHPKGVNRFAHFSCFLFELENDACDIISEKEQEIHNLIWLDNESLEDFRLPAGHQFLIHHILSSGL